MQLRASQSGTSPLARLVLFMTCLGIIAGIGAFGALIVSTGQLQNTPVQVPENGMIGPVWNYCKLVSSGPENFGVVCKNKGGTPQSCQMTYACVKTVCPGPNDLPYEGDDPSWEKFYSAFLLKRCGVTV